MAVSVSTIIEQVRYRIDEQTVASDYLTTYMDNTIKACIPDALRWVCMYADPALLTGNSSSETSPAVKVFSFTGTSGTNNSATLSDGVVTLPANYLRTLRVRVSSWKRSVGKLIQESSDEYLMQSDDTAKADAMNPIVAEINDVPQKLELFPKPGTNDTTSITVVTNPAVESSSTITGSTTYDVPEKARTAFYYYLAYLVMIAYNDSKANQMYAAAKASLGSTEPITKA